MKFIPLTMLSLMVSANVAAQVIIFEEEVRSSRVTVINGGYVDRHGDFEIIRRPRERAQGRVRIGSKVITSDNRSGVIKSMFVSDDKVVVYDNYYGNRTWRLKDIAVTSGCVGPFCVGDSVITDDNRSGEVKGFFNNGKIVVYDNYYGNRTWSQNKIAITDGCDNTFCIGDRVITSDNRNGVVKGFHADGKVIVYDNYYGNRQWSQNNISITNGVCGNIYIERVHFCPR